jgi:hypothetical protein
MSEETKDVFSEWVDEALGVEKPVPKLRVVNHARLLVSFAGAETLKPETYKAKAGVESLPDGKLRVSFPGSRKGLKGCDAGLVDDKPVKVLSIEDSTLVRGMVNLIVDPST